jgi:hypothetical protein
MGKQNRRCYWAAVALLCIVVGGVWLMIVFR